MKPITARATASSLRAYVQRCGAEHGIDLTGGRVLLLCYPRLLGYTFNPLSVYFCYRADGELALRHLRSPQHLWRYPSLCAAGRGRASQRCRRPAGAGQAVLCLALHRDGDALPFPRLAAGRARQAAHSRDRSRRPAAFSDLQRPPPRADHGRRCCARSSRLPLVTLKIMAAIHWEALRLWLKGARLVPRPNAAAQAAAWRAAKGTIILRWRCLPAAKQL